MKTITTAKNKSQMHVISIKYLTVTAVMAAMITLMTAYIFHIPLGVNGGYIHLGDALIYLAAAVLPMPYACAAAVIGGGLADLMTAPLWAPATIIIKAFICVFFSSHGNKIITKRNILALFGAGCVTIAGYYIAEGILFGFTAAFLVMVTGNLVQAAGSGVLFFVFGAALDKIGFKAKFMM